MLSTKAETTPFNILEPVRLQMTFCPFASSTEANKLLVVVLPFVPHTTKMSFFTSFASSERIGGYMERAAFPASVAPCFPVRRQAVFIK